MAALAGPVASAHATPRGRSPIGCGGQVGVDVDRHQLVDLEPLLPPRPGRQRRVVEVDHLRPPPSIARPRPVVGLLQHQATAWAQPARAAHQHEPRIGPRRPRVALGCVGRHHLTIEHMFDPEE